MCGSPTEYYIKIHTHMYIKIRAIVKFGTHPVRKCQGNFPYFPDAYGNPVKGSGITNFDTCSDYFLTEIHKIKLRIFSPHTYNTSYVLLRKGNFFLLLYHLAEPFKCHLKFICRQQFSNGL